jgi:hypothetical protein
VTIRFTPAAAGAYNGYIRVFSDASNGSDYDEAYATGTGVQTQPSLSIINGLLSFGNVNVGDYKELTLSIKNTGTATLNVSSISLPSGYSGNYSGTIAPNNTQNVTIRFTPTAAQSYNGTLSVSSNAGTQSIPISGTGLQQSQPIPTFTPSLGTYTACPPAGAYNCGGISYLGNTIQASIDSYIASTNKITFRIKKCSGNFTNTGTLYVKSGSSCASMTQVASTSYSVGASSVIVSVTPPSRSGTYIYSFFIHSGTTDKFYANPIGVKY